jgi:hypothetical protein
MHIRRVEKRDMDFDFIFELRREEASRRVGRDSYWSSWRVWKGLPMQTVYLGIGFLMMVVLPFLISKRGAADSDVRPSYGSSKL